MTPERVLGRPPLVLDQRDRERYFYRSIFAARPPAPAAYEA